MQKNALTRDASINEKEVAKFSAIADEWWSETGKFKPLHKFNPIRIAYIRDTILNSSLATDASSQFKPFAGLSLLDVGCGGGLLSEPMARLGANVTAIDASETNIRVASLHAENVGLTIDYQATSAEKLASEGKQFDVVLAMEVIEHVESVESFMAACCTLVKPGGLLFVATMNRTVKSYMLAIVGAEYILRWLPRGTHDWKKFLKPSEIAHYFRQNDLALTKIQGVSFNPLQQSWHLSSDTDVNYMMVARKL